MQRFIGSVVCDGALRIGRARYFRGDCKRASIAVGMSALRRARRPAVGKARGLPALSLHRNAARHSLRSPALRDPNFEKRYGEVGKGYIEIHHLNPLAERFDAVSGEPIRTKAEDVVPLCANCHRVVHRTRPSMTLDALISTIRDWLSLARTTSTSTTTGALGRPRRSPRRRRGAPSVSQRLGQRSLPVVFGPVLTYPSIRHGRPDQRPDTRLLAG
jgi:hypothetical protein